MSRVLVRRGVRRKGRREVARVVRRGVAGEYRVMHFLSDVLRKGDFVDVDMWSYKVEFLSNGTLVIEPPAHIIVDRDGKAYLILYRHKVPVKELPKTLVEDIKHLIEDAEHVRKLPIKNFIIHLQRDV